MRYADKLKAMGGKTFEDLVKSSGRMVLMLITPAMAAGWLGNLYRGQRKRSSGFVSQYEKSMAEGHWRVSNDAIVITKDGECINGQHRLVAVVENNEPIVAWVLLDADPDMYDIIDNINPRSAAQVLNCPNQTSIAAAARCILSIDAGSPFYDAVRAERSVPRWMITDKAFRDMDYLQHLVRVQKSFRRAVGLGSGLAYGLAIHVMAAVRDDFDIDDAVVFVNAADATTLCFHRAIQKMAKKGKQTRQEWICGTTLKFLESKAEGKQVKAFGNQDGYLKKYEQAYREKIGIAESGKQPTLQL